MEWKLFEGEFSEFASQEWHNNREAAHHLDQKSHRPRMQAALDFVLDALSFGALTAVDLGCGDGGMLSLLKEKNIKSWGYDFTPANIEYATKIRQVDARLTNFNQDQIEYGDIAILTEVLEHLENPHSIIKNLPSKYLIASSPYNENDKNYTPYHIWAWDEEGYQNLIQSNGYKILKHSKISGWSQIILAERI
jgi:2-polyprenyl-3-methyl-5-hydroxy-6-metoxy-1,4-benzoquinol methylase